MAKTPRRSPPSVKTAASTTSTSLSTKTTDPLPPTLKSRWSPRPHHDDPTVKTHDFAYLTGIPPPTFTAKLIASTKTILLGALSEPSLLRTLLLIFGGCCSNVCTLESILSLSSSTGTLITLLQFLAITLYTLPSQLTFTVVSPPEPPPLRPTQTVWFPRIKKRKVPLSQWCIFAAQFVVINVLNNAAFEYKISLPLHIILRSAGPVASMCVEYIWKGRAYSRRKVFSVGLLFLGVVLAALSDAGAKSPAPAGAKNGESKIPINTTTTMNDQVPSEEPQISVLSQQLPGFILLTLALLLSSIMGIWSDALYSRYGRSPQIASEQLFYGHLLSLPFFVFQHRTLRHQLTNLMTITSTNFTSPLNQPHQNITPSSTLLAQLNSPTLSTLTSRLLSTLTHTLTIYLPPPLPLMFLNSITQIACISGVHHLSTQTSALTVSIVLNVRKVVSLLLSVWVFGSSVTGGVLVGAGLVFLGGGIYGVPEGDGDSKKKVGKRVVEAEKRRLAGEAERERESKKDR